MDDYSVTSLGESRNEWVARLIDVMTPATIEGLKSIFEEAVTICAENDEEDKYLMTFQTFLSRIPKWNPEIISKERERIETTSGCSYLEDLITCVHVIQLKALTCVRVGTKQKKVDIDVPSANDFVHRVYIIAARKLYTNVYLFERNVVPLQQQRYMRELELLVREAVLSAVRDGVPVEGILRAYMDQTEETVEEADTHVPVPSSAKTTVNTPASSSASAPVVAPAPAPVVAPVPAPAPVVAPAPASAPVVASAPAPAPAPAPVIASTPISNIVIDSVEKPISKTIEPIILSTDKPANHVSVEDISASTKASSALNTTMPPKDNSVSVSFTELDNAISVSGEKSVISAPKDDETLNIKAEEGAKMRAALEDDDDDDSISIGEEVKLEIGELVEPLASPKSNSLEEISVIPL